MEAVTRGALAAGGEVGGIRISREAGTTVLTASYLPQDSAVLCTYLSSRKVRWEARRECNIQLKLWACPPGCSIGPPLMQHNDLGTAPLFQLPSCRGHEHWHLALSYHHVGWWISATLRGAGGAGGQRGEDEGA